MKAEATVPFPGLSLRSLAVHCPGSFLPSLGLEKSPSGKAALDPEMEVTCGGWQSLPDLQTLVSIGM